MSRRHGAAVPRRRGRARARPISRSANEIGIREFDGQTTGRAPRDLAHASRGEPRSVPRARRRRRRQQVGAYPARWQAFHLAFELATHADDVGVPVTDGRGGGPHRVAGAVRPLRAEGDKPEHRDRGPRRPHARARRRRRRRPPRRRVRRRRVAARLPGDSGARRRDRAPYSRRRHDARRRRPHPRHRRDRPGRACRSRSRSRRRQRRRSRSPASGTRRSASALEAAGVTCVDGRPRARHARRRAGRRRLRLQLRGREERTGGTSTSPATPRRPAC